MSEKWMRIRRWLIGISCCSLALGIIMVIWPEISVTVLCWILGLLGIGIGVYELVRYSQLGFAGLFFRFDFILGLCNIAIGIILLLPFGGSVFLPFAVGLYVLISSIFNIQLAFNISKYRMGSWITTLILGIIGLIFSIFLFVDPFKGATALMVFIGASLVVNGVQGLYDVACLTKAIKTSDGPKVRDSTNVIDAQWTDVE